MVLTKLPEDLLRVVAEYTIELRIAGFVPIQKLCISLELWLKLRHAMACRCWKAYSGGFVKFMAPLPCGDRYLVVSMIPYRLNAHDEELHQEACENEGVPIQLRNINGRTMLRIHENAWYPLHFTDRYYIEPNGVVFGYGDV